MFEYLNFDDPNRIRAWISLDLAGRPLLPVEKAQQPRPSEDGEQKVKKPGYVSIFTNRTRLPTAEILLGKEGDVDFKGDPLLGSAVYEGYASHATPAILKTIYNTLNMIAEDMEQD